MNIKELKEKMIDAERKYNLHESQYHDYEKLHVDHDNLLLEYINDPEVTEIFDRTSKWYA